MGLLWILGIPVAAFAGVTVFRYLRSIRALVESLRDHSPETWARLGRPEWERMVVGGRSRFTVTPMFPFLAWVIKGEPTGRGRLDAETRRRYETTRRLLGHGLVGLLLWLGLLMLIV